MQALENIRDTRLLDFMVLKISTETVTISGKKKYRRRL